ncbi:MAG: SdpI family protein [Candidatus Latescibacteria bacterium]|nr:SdpI family protein [Candidatus Latescibacterota bacterium]
MKLRKSEVIVLIIILLSLAISIYFNPKLPDKIVAHWDYKGEADGYMAKSRGIFLMPAFLFVLFLVFLFVPRLDPLKANVEKFRKYFDGFIILLFMFMLVIHLQTILWALGTKIKPNVLFPVGLGVLFYYVGIMLNHSQRNWFIGLRTPWTLSSDSVWEKTHKFGAKLIKISAVIAMSGALFQNFAMFIVLAPIIGSFIYLTVYSYIEYKKENK